MALKQMKRVPQTQNRASYIWHRQQPAHGTVCKFWLAGNCTRNPCRFLHPKPAKPINNQKLSNQSRHGDLHRSQKIQKVSSKNVNQELNHCQRKQETGPKNTNEVPIVNSQKKVEPCPTKVTNSADESTQKVENKVCEYWITGNCVKGEKCGYAHSWYSGDGFTKLTELEGHKKHVSGIELPLGSDKLLSSSQDGIVRVWNCHTGECVATFDMGCEVGCMTSDGPWVFIGIKDAVQAWNIQTDAKPTLRGPVGQVCALTTGHDMLFAGVQDGTILAWEFGSEPESFKPMGKMKGHTGAVVALTFGAEKVYSSSLDKTIRSWNPEDLQCTHTLTKHAEVVTSMICWDYYLLTCSLDRTLKVWAATESGDLEVVHTHNEEHGILALCGIDDAKRKSILLCSCNDNSVRLYDLPSFHERGRLFARQEVRTIQIGPDGLFFTGDATGRVSVWKLLEQSNTSKTVSS